MLAPRHLFIGLSFLFFAVAPSAFVTWYMLSKAADQFASSVAFVIQQADAPSVPTLELLGSSLEEFPLQKVDASLRDELRNGRSYKYQNKTSRVI